MHVTKYTKGTLGHMLGHYDRTKDGLGENVVSERTQLNYNLAVNDQPLKQHKPKVFTDFLMIDVMELLFLIELICTIFIDLKGKK